jgi:hypothetical protein
LPWSGDLEALDRDRDVDGVATEAEAADADVAGGNGLRMDGQGSIGARAYPDEAGEDGFGAARREAAFGRYFKNTILIT